jgi:1,4-dihydroxy-2-naphthoyl-CoA hydrolase
MNAPVPPQQTLDTLLGLEFFDVEEEEARCRFTVTDSTRQMLGIVHGGTYAAAAESLVSLATHLVVSKDGQRALGQSNHTSFIRPVVEGTVHGEARARHRGRTSWIWDVDFSDDEGRLCAVARVTIAVRPSSAERS